MKSAIGIDIGGTKIALGLGLASGKQLASIFIPTQTEKKTKTCLSHLLQQTGHLISLSHKKKLKLSGIGVCLPGPVDSSKGIVPRSPNLPGWKGIPLKKLLEQKFRLPVVMANDAKAVAVAESVYGQGRGVQNFIYMTVSTGIGSGIFSNGRLLEGASFAAGEVGHMVIVPEGNLCKCGKRGCLEAYASGTALADYAVTQIKHGVRSCLKSRLHSEGFISAKMIGEAARKKDQLALETYRRGGYYLGVGIASLLNVLNPDKLILGGGVFSSAPSLFWKSMIQSARLHAWPEVFQVVQVTRTKLQGHTGALALVFQPGKGYYGK